ncbi:MAG TPA: hypothetical protein VFY93_11510 [Planctomycetota bacterium]|nr:hypothetical protein [Planctomycetota bacterium]
MTEDPVKLYVIVMGILLLVLSYVAYDSWAQASAYEEAIARAPREADQMKQLASEVKGLVDQIAKSELRDGGERVLIERVEKTMNLSRSRYTSDTVNLGRGVKGHERRFTYEYGQGKASPPMRRGEVVRFCESVERASGGIVKTIELHLRRATGQDQQDPGKTEKVTDDQYKAEIVFGLRVVD